MFLPKELYENVSAPEPWWSCTVAKSRTLFGSFHDLNTKDFICSQLLLKQVYSHWIAVVAAGTKGKKFIKNAFVLS